MESRGFVSDASEREHTHVILYKVQRLNIYVNAQSLLSKFGALTKKQLVIQSIKHVEFCEVLNTCTYLSHITHKLF